MEDICALARLGVGVAAGGISDCCIGAGDVEDDEESEGVGDGDAGLFRVARLRRLCCRVCSAVLCPSSSISVRSSSGWATDTEFQPNTVSFRGGAMLARETNPEVLLEESTEKDDPDKEESDGDTGGEGILNEVGKVAGLMINCSVPGKVNWGVHAGLAAHVAAYRSLKEARSCSLSSK